MDVSEAEFYKDGIKVEVDDIIIEGNGHYIDAKNKTRILWITGNNVLIVNLKFRNGFNTFGGAIFNQGNITLGSCVFENNTALFGGVHYLMSQK